MSMIVETANKVSEDYELRQAAEFEMEDDPELRVKFQMKKLAGAMRNILNDDMRSAAASLLDLVEASIF